MLSIDDRGPFPPCPQPFNLAHHVLWHSGAPDDKIAMAILSAARAKRWSYGRLRDAVMRAGSGLIAAGAATGDRVMLHLGNSPHFPIVFLGAIAAGILPVPISSALTEGEVARITAAVAPRLTIGPTGLSPDDLQDADPLNASVLGDPGRPAYIVFTSGTSGTPMGVVHAHRAIWARTAMIDGWYGLQNDDRVLHAGAFNWTYTLGTGLLDPWSVGATALVLADGTEAAMLPLLLKRHDATLFAAVPGVFRRLLRGPIPPLPKLRHALSAGEKLPVTVAEAWENATGTAIHEAFGQSEVSTFISASPDRPTAGDVLGYTQNGRRVAVVSNGAPVLRGTPGDIAISADDPGVMLGYLDAPEATKTRCAGEWFLTGDTGVMLPDGGIVYVGRNDDILTAGGHRVSPVEVENAMLSHPAIADAAAVDERVGPDTTLIALHYTSDNPLAEAELTEHAARHLTRYKQPRLFHYRESLPRSAAGKLLRRAIRAERDEA